MNQSYKTKYVWNDNGLCDISYLWKSRHCNVCGRKGRFLVNVGYKTYQCLTCGINHNEKK